MRWFIVVLELVIALVGIMALVAMGGGWFGGVLLLCIACGIGVVLSRQPR
ncbi:MAG: hypothetical protein WCI22_00205 [Actinomycetota bacterium]